HGESAVVAAAPAAGPKPGNRRGPIMPSARVLLSGLTAPPPCTGDANGDRQINFADIISVLQAWGTTPPAFGLGDANGDARVDFGDVIAVLQGWGAACG
ncbi:MAG: hypothetical protein SFZ24_12225, partial [Planctomycetota bacterium]|nr:hypothetical protein [Planctomycetota bacterium]